MIFDYSSIRPVGDPISKNHPFWHICRKCLTFGKVVGILLLVDVTTELITFLPVHRFFQSMGWIS